jgi:hypothetical protein
MGWGTGVRFSTGQEVFHFSTLSRPTLRLIQPTIQGISGAISLGEKRPHLHGTMLNKLSTGITLLFTLCKHNIEKSVTLVNINTTSVFQIIGQKWRATGSVIGMEEFLSPHTAPVFGIEISLRMKGLELEAGSHRCLKCLQLYFQTLCI